MLLLCGFFLHPHENLIIESGSSVQFMLHMRLCGKKQTTSYGLQTRKEEKKTRVHTLSYSSPRINTHNTHTHAERRMWSRALWVFVLLLLAAQINAGNLHDPSIHPTFATLGLYLTLCLITAIEHLANELIVAGHFANSRWTHMYLHWFVLGQHAGLYHDI